ncbi:MAG: DUF2059 domain-containing protein [Bacteroidota bacterium]
MKKISTFVLLSFVYLSLCTAQETDTYASTLKEMFEVSGTENTYKAAITQVFSMFKQKYNDVDPEIWTELEGEFMQTSLDELVDMLVPVYSKHLTEEDMHAVIEFYSTPVGKKFAEKTPLITQESMQIGQSWGMKIGEEFVKKMEERGYR